MSRQSAVHVFAGFMIVLSLALAHWVSPWWLLLTLFVGLNLFQYGLTGFCPAEFVFGKCGLRDATCKPEKTIQK
ncbi:MAG TPA: DUF2892 domain-containing protein [Tepidisphaeraceae bacterium]|nr:DUF2892 domain-containing protein [Tepidisphaeraceae bacterium]